MRSKKLCRNCKKILVCRYPLPDKIEGCDYFKESIPKKLQKEKEIEYEWIEVFGMPSNWRLENEEPSDTLRFYPNHLFIKIEVV